MVGSDYGMVVTTGVSRGTLSVHLAAPPLSLDRALDLEADKLY